MEYRLKVHFSSADQGHHITDERYRNCGHKCKTVRELLKRTLLNEIHVF